MLSTLLFKFLNFVLDKSEDMDTGMFISCACPILIFFALLLLITILLDLILLPIEVVIGFIRLAIFIRKEEKKYG